MPRKFYTIFVLPHAHARFRKIHVSRNFILVLSGLLGLAVFAGATTPHLFLTIRSRTEALTRLREENRKLRSENLRFEASLSQIGSQLNAFESGLRRLAGAVGLKDVPGLHRAAGGAHPGPDVKASPNGMLVEEMQAIRSRASNLDRSLAQVNQKWEERLRVLASTPHGMPVLGSLADGYGWRQDPFGAGPEFHSGIDIVAPQGTLVLATAEGVVSGSGRASGYGKNVTLSHGFGLSTLYGHLGEILVTPGQRIHRGDAVGRVGSTGRSTGPHLHYEVYKGGRQVDPRRYLSEDVR